MIRYEDYDYTFTMPDEDVTIMATFLAPKDPVVYLDENGASQTAEYYDLLSGEESTIETGWYVLSADRDFSGRITVIGDVHLILCDSCTFNANNGGIRLTQYDRLTIYAQSTGGNRGVLTAKAVAEKYAGIGGDYCENGGTVTINGGDVTVIGGDAGSGIGSGYTRDGDEITINSGVVNVSVTGEGAAIGGAKNGAGGKITINGGKVTAEGGTNGAGIGCGEGGHCSEIIISGGEVIAYGGYAAAGIGSGYKCDNGSECGDITITISGGYEGAGIGTGEGANCTEIIISGGIVYAEGGNYAAGIGGGGQESDIGATCGDITITAGVIQVTAKKGRSEEWIDSIGRGYEGFCGTVTIEPGANVIQW